jgi:hypothetical protein
MIESLRRQLAQKARHTVQIRARATKGSVEEVSDCAIFATLMATSESSRLIRLDGTVRLVSEQALGAECRALAARVS